MSFHISNFGKSYGHFFLNTFLFLVITYIICLRQRQMIDREDKLKQKLVHNSTDYKNVVSQQPSTILMQ